MKGKVGLFNWPPESLSDVEQADLIKHGHFSGTEDMGKLVDIIKGLVKAADELSYFHEYAEPQHYQALNKRWRELYDFLKSQEV